MKLTLPAGSVEDLGGGVVRVTLPGSGLHSALTGRDAADSHPAVAVSYDPVTGGDILTATDVQAAIDEMLGLPTPPQSFVSATEPEQQAAGTVWVQIVTMPDATLAYAIRVRDADGQNWTEPAQVHLDAIGTVRSWNEFNDDGIEHYVFREDGSKVLEVGWNEIGGYYYKVFPEGSAQDSAAHVASFISDVGLFEAHVIPSGEGVNDEGRIDFMLRNLGAGPIVTTKVHDDATGQERVSIIAKANGARIDAILKDATGQERVSLIARDNGDGLVAAIKDATDVQRSAMTLDETGASFSGSDGADFGSVIAGPAGVAVTTGGVGTFTVNGAVVATVP